VGSLFNVKCENRVSKIAFDRQQIFRVRVFSPTNKSKSKYSHLPPKGERGDCDTLSFGN